MIEALFLLVSLIGSSLKNRAELVLENLALQQQLAILNRKRPQPRLRKRDRLFWAWLSAIWQIWRESLIVVKPETVVRWHRKGFALYWKCLSTFRDPLAGGGVESVRLPARSPNLNSQAEGFVRSLKGECLEPMIFFGEKSLPAATVAYMEHFLTERNHQGMGNRLLIPGSEVGEKVGEVICRERLGGLLRYYYRKAA